MASRIPPRPMHQPIQRRPRVESGSHLDFIRSLPCLICGAQAEAAHIRMSAAHVGKINPGVGARSDDAWTVPLCPDHHRNGPQSQHGVGDEAAWWKSHGIDPLLIALALWKASGDYEIGQGIIWMNRRGAA